MHVSLQKVFFCFIFLSIIFVSFCSAPALAGNPPDPAHSSLISSPTSIPADGTTTATLTLTLQDSSGTPLATDSVQLSSPNDPTAVISPLSSVLNVSGVATFTVTSTRTGTTTFNVTDTTTGTTLLDLGQVVVTSVSSSTSSSGNGGPSCNDPFPVAAPNLYAVFKNSNHTSVTLYFVPPPPPFDGFTISYGLSQSADTYSTSFSQGPSTGAIKYVVNALIKDAPYFFKVRANNGCAAGPWSNERSTSVAVSSLPKTGPSNIFVEIGIAGALTVLAGAVFLFVF